MGLGAAPQRVDLVYTSVPDPVLLVRKAAQLFGLGLTLLALATSMFWFAAPETPSPMALEVLASERDYLLDLCTWWKVAIALIIPATFVAISLAFWNRSFTWGIAVVNVIVLAKVAWSFAFFTVEGALYHLVPAALGLVICNVVRIAAWRWLIKPRALPSSSRVRL